MVVEKPGFTPGPWRSSHVGWRGDDGYDIYVTGDHDIEHEGDGESLEVCTGVAVVMGNEAAEAIAEANARLIVAAPELLAACQAFIDLFMDPDMRPEDEWHDLFYQVREAVDKATKEGSS